MNERLAARLLALEMLGRMTRPVPPCEIDQVLQSSTTLTRGQRRQVRNALKQLKLITTAPAPTPGSLAGGSAVQGGFNSDEGEEECEG